MKLDGKTNAELVALSAQIEAHPANRMPPGSLYLYTPQARKRLHRIAEQITHNLAEARRAAGNPVPCNGYSGRKSNHTCEIR